MPFGYGTSKNYSPTTTSSTTNREDNRTTQYTRYTPAQVKSGKVNEAKLTKTSDAKRLKDLKYEPKKTGIVSLDIVSSILGKRSFDMNKPYFENNVGGKYVNGVLSGYKASPEDYKRYITDRSLGKVDAYGREIKESNRPDSPAPTIIKKNIGGNTIQTTAPTEAEVSQSEAANADAAALKVKKRGRSASIMTGPKGVTKTSTDYSLGMKSLLGRV